MATRTVAVPSQGLGLDFLLEAAIRSLELTPDQYERAQTAGRAAGEWLSAPGSPLAYLQPQIYPQGSMALRTTVRPILSLEHDLDMVCQMLAEGYTAMELYELVEDRLLDSAIYRERLSRKNRCLRIQYANDFHLDIIPATLDLWRPSPCILVPDRKLQNWTPSNPLGFIGWFKMRAGGAPITKAIVPLLPQALLERTTLSVAVQLCKRRRDVEFDDSDLSPRSIVLTTLAALAYDGEPSVATALLKVLTKIENNIRAAWPKRLEVVNPTNPAERFSDCFTDASYSAFARFVISFRQEMADLIGMAGIPQIKQKLALMFGAGPAGAAVRAFEEHLAADREEGLRFTPTSGIIVGGASKVGSIVVPRNTFFGE